MFFKINILESMDKENKPEKKFLGAVVFKYNLLLFSQKYGRELIKAFKYFNKEGQYDKEIDKQKKDLERIAKELEDLKKEFTILN